MSGQNKEGADSPASAAEHAERLKWYQEVLSLDPDSRIFLPYARLIARSGRSDTAIGILKKGLAKHPEFLEARLDLLDLLEGSGQRSAAMAEASELIGQLSSHPALWEIWSRMPGVRQDMSAMLIFFASCMKSEGFTLADVFSAGLSSLRGTGETSSAAAPCNQAGQASGPAEQHPDSDLLPWRSLDEVPDDDDLAEDAGESSEDLPVRHPGSLPDGQKSGISLPGPIPPSATAGKCSLLTRSMAAVLEEQGALEEAADIYRELIGQARSDEERAELNAKLESLTRSIPAAEGQQHASVIGMLEELADHLEKRARG